MRRAWLAWGGAVWLAAAPAIAAHDGHDHGKAEAPGTKQKEGRTKSKVRTGTVTGVVVDLACQILGERPDPGHAGCVKGGVPVGLVDAKGRLWIAINSSYGSATEMLVPHMGGEVRAEGWYVERKGERLISISRVEPVEPAGSAAAKPAAQVWVCPHGCSRADKPGRCACGMELVRRSP